MKTLVRPQVDLTIATSSNHLYRQNTLVNNKFQERKNFFKFKFLLLAFSFFTVIIFPDNPEKASSICNKYHVEQVCKVW